MMTRKAVAIENRTTVNNQRIVYGALTWPSKPVPVFVTRDLTTVVGQAKSFERDPDGTITADILLTDLEYKNYYCAVDVKDVSVQMRDGVLTVIEGEIAGVSAIQYWPWEEIRFVPLETP
jgi:hypothetical protein